MSIPPELQQKISEFLEENQQLNADLKLKEEQLKQKEDLLLEYEEEINKLQTQLKPISSLQASVTSLQSQNKYLREIVDEKTSDLSNVRLELEAKGRELSDLQKVIAESNQPQVLDYSVLEKSSEPSHSAEIERLEKELEDALYKLASVEHREKSLKQNLEKLSEEYEHVKVDNQSLRSNIKDLKYQNLDLQTEIQDMKSVNSTAKRGNSMFSEVADEYRKLEEDMKKIVKELSVVKKENYYLKDEIEESRLLATRKEGLEKKGRCICDELKPELEQERLRVEQLQRTVHVLQSELQKAGSTIKSEDAGRVLKSMHDSLRTQLDNANKEIIDLRLSRNTLKDKTISLSTMLKQIENREKMAKEEVDLLKRRMEKEISKEPSVSTTFKSAADGLAQLKNSLQTPAKKSDPSVLTPVMKTPVEPMDALRRLTLSQSATLASLSESTNETIATRERRLRKENGKKKGILKPLVNNFTPLQMEIQTDGAVKVEEVEVPSSLNDTAAMFDGPKLPPAKFKIPTAPLKIGLSSTGLNQTKLFNQSMEMDITQKDVFDFDFSKNPFPDQSICDANGENEDPLIQ